MALAIGVCEFVEDVDLEGGREFRSGAIALIRQLCSPGAVYPERRRDKEDRTRTLGSETQSRLEI